MTKSTSKGLPRGIRLVPIPGRKKSLGVQWWADGKRKTKCFANEEQRSEFARTLVSSVSKIGVAAYRLDEAEARAWRSFVADLNGAGLDEVLRCWRKHGKSSDAMTVSEAVEAYSKAKEAEGVSKVALDHYRPIFKRFSAVYGQREVRSIEREEVAAWVAGIKGAEWTRRSHHKRVASLFAWLKNNRMLAENPCDGLRPVKITADEVEILTLAQARLLFEKNQERSRELCGRLALEAFAGLRFSSAAQIVAGDLVDEGIVLPADKIKTRRRQFIDGLPANLTSWLEWSKPSEWKMTHRAYLEAKSQAFTWANVPHPHNCLRHSFASYHVAANKDASKTAAILCHTSPKTLYAHYKGRATAADGAAYFEITPPASSGATSGNPLR